MKQLDLQLKALGLSDYEARIYGALIAASPASATTLARSCSLSRSSVYTTLATLISKGLVGTTYKNNVKQFIAQDQSALEAILKKEKQSLDQKFALVEKLKEAAQFFGRSDTQVPQIIYFEGQEGLKKIYLSMMRQAPMRTTRYLLRDEFIWQPEWTFVFENEWSERVKRFAKEKEMQTKLLINPSKLEKSKAKYYKAQKAFAYRFLPEAHQVRQFAWYIIGDSIAILSMEKNNLVGVQITNAHVADNFKKTFDALWASAKAR